ncbi:MAG: choice-of-anchor I family protein [Microbacteriaceae bacterium]|nr:choice-of-anchor I family protein [Microbacteriaceae bacterium]
MPRIGAASLAAVLALALLGLSAPAASAEPGSEPVVLAADDAALTLSPIGSYDTGVFDESAAEIVAYFGDRLFVVNALAGTVDVLDVSNPAEPVKLFGLANDGVAGSVAVRADGLGAIALEAPTKTDNGTIAFFDAAAGEADAPLGAVTVGALPDMVTFSPDGRFAVVANEGEPNDDYTIDPEGSVSIVTLPQTRTAPTQSAVRTAGFTEFEQGGSRVLDERVRVFAGIASDTNPVSRSFEPEYVAVIKSTAYVVLQEANAVAEVRLTDAEVTHIRSFGFKDHGVSGAGLDPSDRDPRGAPEVDIRTFPGLFGMYMPDGITAYKTGGRDYLVTANEGDAREWGDYEEGARVGDLEVCESSPLAAFTGDADLGRLNVTTENGFNAALDCYEELYAFGARSFSIWTPDGDQVFDSGDALEEITATASPAFFNSNHSESNLEGRSDDKGPEPENLAIGKVRGHTYAFIGLERVGGVVVYDITTPADSRFVTYINNRDFSVSVEDADDQGATLAAAGDLGPEGLAFIPAKESPTGQPMLAVGNEVSGTTTLFSIDTVSAGKQKKSKK